MPFVDLIDELIELTADDAAHFGCAAEIARGVVTPETIPELPEPTGPASPGALPGRSVVVVRSLVPRTFVDCNRDIDGAADDFRRANLTSAIPGFIRDQKISARAWPLNPDSYLIIMAGPDHMYGTDDDVTNFR